MRRRRSGSLGLAAVVAASLLATAVPARAATSDSCRDPEWIAYCACLVVGGIGSELVPGTQWSCSRP